MCAYCFHFQYCLLLPRMNAQLHIRYAFFRSIPFAVCTVCVFVFHSFFFFSFVLFYFICSQVFPYSFCLLSILWCFPLWCCTLSFHALRRHLEYRTVRILNIHLHRSKQPGHSNWLLLLLFNVADVDNLFSFDFYLNFYIYYMLSCTCSCLVLRTNLASLHIHSTSVAPVFLFSVNRRTKKKKTHTLTYNLLTFQCVDDIQSMFALVFRWYVKICYTNCVYHFVWFEIPFFPLYLPSIALEQWQKKKKNGISKLTHSIVFNQFEVKVERIRLHFLLNAFRILNGSAWILTLFSKKSSFNKQMKRMPIRSIENP